MYDVKARFRLRLRRMQRTIICAVGTSALFIERCLATTSKEATAVPERHATSNTLLLGERSHLDANYDSYAVAGLASRPSMASWGWWAASEGRLAGDVTLSAYVSLNYQGHWATAPEVGDRSRRSRSSGSAPSSMPHVCFHGVARWLGRRERRRMVLLHAAQGNTLRLLARRSS